MSALQRTDLFATPIWTVDLVELAPTLPALVAAAETFLAEHPAPANDLYEQSAASLQDHPEPAWIEFFRILAATFEAILAHDHRVLFEVERAYLRSWVLRMGPGSGRAHGGSTLDVLHSHLPAVLSSVLYLQVPDVLVDAPFGGTTFRDPNAAVTRAHRRPEVHVGAAPLRLVVFPSYLEHCPELPPAGTVVDGARLVVATDLRVAPA